MEQLIFRVPPHYKNALKVVSCTVCDVTTAIRAGAHRDMAIREQDVRE